MGEHEKRENGPTPNPSPKGEGKRPPRWTIAFLRALERTAQVEAAARDAGIDRTTAYLRRRSHPDFAEAWESALQRREGVVQAEVQERVGFWEKVKGKVTPKLLGSSPVLGCPPDSLRSGGPSTIGSSANGPPPHAARREELLASTALGGKLVRAGPGRWNQAAEQRFFDELAATANVKRAAAAAGVSQNAVYARRMKRPDFKAKWDAVLETGRAAIEMHLVETAKKSFDPDELDTGDVQPRVSVGEAIKIVQLHGSKAQKNAIEEIEPPAHEVAEIRERLVQKLHRLRDRMMPEMLAEGWSYDEAHDHMVPPGWVKAET